MKMATDIFGNSNDYEYAYLLTCLRFDDDNDDILNKLNNFIDIEIYADTSYNKQYYYQLHNNSNLINLVDNLEHIYENNKQFRYLLKFKLKSKKHPSTIHLSKKGNHVFTRQRSKNISI